MMVRAIEDVRLFDIPHSEWPTPQAFFEQLAKEFAFTLDAAATRENTKCARYFTAEDNGLAQTWEGVVWCNPPYGRGIDAWIRKGWESAQAGATVVMLLPVRTSPAYFHDYIWGKAEVRFVRGRISFGIAKKGHNAPFDSMVVIWRPVAEVLRGV